MKVRVVHLSSVHLWNDVRILVRECSTLARAGYETYYVSAGAPPISEAHGVRLEGITTERSRIKRMLLTQLRLYRRVRALRADIYHFHDPELIFAGILLQRRGAKVVYDVHENLPHQVLTKEWLPPRSRPVVARGAEWVEQKAARYMNAIVAATPAIARRFPAAKVVVVQNFPLRDELIQGASVPYAQRDYAVGYVGGLTSIRGAREIVQAIALVQSVHTPVLEVAGTFYPQSLQQELETTGGWRRVRYHGLLSRTQVAELLGRVRAGIVTFHPVPNHIEAQPNKLFEYLSAGIPVIASDFPLWRQLIGEPPCGLLVNPLDPAAIANAIDWIFTHPTEAEQMGRYGRAMVEERYNWDAEAEKLLALYERLAGLP